MKTHTTAPITDRSDRIVAVARAATAFAFQNAVHVARLEGANPASTGFNTLAANSAAERAWDAYVGVTLSTNDAERESLFMEAAGLGQITSKILSVSLSADVVD